MITKNFNSITMEPFITTDFKMMINSLITKTEESLNLLDHELNKLKHEKIMEPTVQGWITYTEKIVALDSIKCILMNGLNDNQQFIKDLNEFYKYI